MDLAINGVGVYRRPRKRTLELVRAANPALGEKVCTRCGTPQPLKQFYKNRRTFDGLTEVCKTCSRASSLRWYERNRKHCVEVNRRWYANNRERVSEQSRTRTHTKKSWELNAIKRCRERATQKGVPFGMRASDLYDASGRLPDTCPIFSHICLDYHGGRDRRKWASVDRKVPELGYVTGNVWVVSMAANVWKSNGSNPRERRVITRLMSGPKFKTMVNSTLELFE